MDRPDNLKENKVIMQFGKVISLIINIIFQFSIDQPNIKITKYNTIKIQLFLWKAHIKMVPIQH